MLITLRGKKRQHFGKVGLQKSPAWFSFRAKNYSKEAKGLSAPWEHVQERVIYSRVYNTIWDTRVRNVDLLVIPGRKDACIHPEFIYTLGYIQIMSALRYTGAKPGALVIPENMYSETSTVCTPVHPDYIHSDTNAGVSVIPS